MSNQESEKLRVIQEFADNYPISDYFEPDFEFYCFSKDELIYLLLKFWIVTERKANKDRVPTNEEIVKIINAINEMTGILKPKTPSKGIKLNSSTGN